MTADSKGINSGMRFSRKAIPGGFWFRVYDVAVPFGVLLANAASPFNRKLRDALHGHRAGIDGWEIGREDTRPCVLLHVASYGEFEGVRPLIDRLNEEQKYRVAVSFSSPSALKVVQSTDGIWARGYLPQEYLHHQLRFLGRLEPSIVLIAKHDFWPNMIRAAKALHIPVMLINGNFHPGSRRMLPLIRSFHRTFMKHLQAVWTVSEADAKRVEPLLSHGTELLAVGDTRYDRVRQRANSGRERFRELKEALGPGPVIVAGSSWQHDENICWTAFGEVMCSNPDARIVVVPHEVTPEAIERNLSAAAALGLKVRLFSDWTGGKIEERALLVDKTGILADLYTIGWAAHVGGGFGRGVHSVIEPVAHAIPVTFGPRHHVSHEASLLLKEGGGFVVRTAGELGQLWRKWLSEPESYDKAAEDGDRVVRSREGATERLMELIETYIISVKV